MTFVSVIRGDIVKLRPELASDTGLLHRLSGAYDEAKRLGFVRDKSIVRFLYLESDVPGFYRQLGMAAWLSKRGSSAEDRFETLLDVIRAKMRVKKETD